MKGRAVEHGIVVDLVGHAFIAHAKPLVRPVQHLRKVVPAKIGHLLDMARPRNMTLRIRKTESNISKVGLVIDEFAISRSDARPSTNVQAVKQWTQIDVDLD